MIMRLLQTHYWCLLVLLLCFSQNTIAQTWENPGSSPSYPIAYDQNGQDRTVVTTHNIYQSSNAGNTWQQKLSSADFAAQGFIHDRCRVFDDVLFVTANTGSVFSSTEWKIYSSSDGGTTLTESFVEENAFSSINGTYGYDHDLYQVDANTYIIRFQSNGIAPSGDDASIYVTTNKGQSWSLLFRHPSNSIQYAGVTANDYVFLFEDELLYRNKNNGSLSNTLNLPEQCYAASVENNNIELISWTNNSTQLRGYTSTNGGASYTNYTTTTANDDYREAQILDNNIFVSAGGFSYQTRSYRLSFSNFNSPVLISEPGFYKNYYPYRITADGNLSNLLPGFQPHVPNIFYNSNGEAYITPFLVSTDNWTSFSPAERPPIALESMPLLDGKRAHHAGGYVWNTTDGKNFTEGFRMSNWASTIKYFEGAMQTSSYSDPSTTHYLTNDASTVASNDANVVGLGNTLYSWRRNGLNSQGIFKSTDQGDTWAFHNDGYFWNFDVIGDNVTNTMYSIERYVSGGVNTIVSLRLAKSTDEGLNWQLLDGANFPTVSRDDYFQNQFLPIVVHNNYFFIKSDDQLLYSTDGGASFQTANNLPFAVAGSKMFLLGGDLCFRTEAEQFFRVDINQWLGAGGGATLPGANIDLSLSVSMSPANPGPWSNFEVTYTVTNSGTIPATGVNLQTFIASSSDAIPQGGTTPLYTGFTSTPPFGRGVAAGQSATVTYFYFRKDGAEIQPYGQVGNHKEPDIDSRPGNANWPNVQEDDEAIIGGTAVCAVSINAFPGDCENNGTPNNPADDKYDLQVVVVNPVPGTGFQLFIPEINQTRNGTYGTTVTINDIAISAGPLTIQVTDNLDASCTGTTTVQAPASCSNTTDPCSPDVTDPVLSGCPGNITRTTSGSSATATWSAPSASDNCAGNPSLTSTHNSGASFPLGTTTVTYTAQDAAGNTSTCSFNVTVNPQGTGQIDLALALQQSTANPTQWSSYSVTATITNDGPQTATNVNVEFKSPDGVVYTGGNEYVASQGSFSPAGNEVWNVGSIPANGSATLTVNYFLRIASAPVAYAQVTAATQTDSDSQPNNGTPPTVNEDDEASTAGGGPNLCTVMQHTVGNIICNDAGTPNNASDDTWTFALSINLAGTGCAGTNWAIAGVATAAYGSTVPVGPFLIADGSKSFTATQIGNASISKTFSVSPPAPCSSGGQEPDMRLSGLTIPNASVAAGAILSYNFDLANIGTADIVGDFTVKAYISTDNTLSANDIQDGTIVTGNFDAGDVSNNVPAASTIPANLAPGNYFLIVKVDADDVLAESNEGNNTKARAFTVTGGGGTDCDAISITASAGTITITGASAPHVLMKVFRPNWSTALNCLDASCGNPEVVSGLTTGNHYVEIKLLNASWNEICKITETVNVSTTTVASNNTSRLSGPTSRMAIEKIYPNPSIEETNLVIYSPEDQEIVIDLYNNLGQKVHQVKRAVLKGNNEIQIDVRDLESGYYNVIGHGNGPAAYGRFIKLWED